MSIGVAGLHKAVASLWQSSGLDTLFKAYWSSADRDYYTTLNDGEVTPGTPFPYVLYGSDESKIVVRMSGNDSGGGKYVLLDVPWTFEIHVQQVVGRTAKSLAALLCERLMKVFGGHPVTAPTALVVEYGNAVGIQYITDYGERTGDDTYKWTIDYNIQLDLVVQSYVQSQDDIDEDSESSSSSSYSESSSSS